MGLDEAGDEFEDEFDINWLAFGQLPAEIREAAD
jgi:hypothetical protein